MNLAALKCIPLYGETKTAIVVLSPLVMLILSRKADESKQIDPVSCDDAEDDDADADW